MLSGRSWRYKKILAAFSLCWWSVIEDALGIIVSTYSFKPNNSKRFSALLLCKTPNAWQLFLCNTKNAKNENLVNNSQFQHVWWLLVAQDSRPTNIGLLLIAIYVLSLSVGQLQSDMLKHLQCVMCTKWLLSIYTNIMSLIIASLNTLFNYL